MTIHDLLAAVEAGTAQPYDFHHTMRSVLEERWAFRAYYGDMDAADYLARTLVPTDAWSVSYHPVAGHYKAVIMPATGTKDDPSVIENRYEASGDADAPARALLIATLRALAEKEKMG